LRRLLRGELDTASLPEPTSGPVFGLLHALKQVADDIGLSSALGKSELGKLALFLVLARIGHQGSRLSAVRWARDHAVAEVLGLAPRTNKTTEAMAAELTRQGLPLPAGNEQVEQARTPAVFVHQSDRERAAADRLRDGRESDRGRENQEWAPREGGPGRQ
jgi:hypothetical protein